jgi:hypothetical protein
MVRGLMLLILVLPHTAFGLNCDGRVIEILSGNAYCSGGERLGFVWTGGGGWMCSTNRNMDALLLTAYSSGKTVSVRDRTWSSCFDHPPGTTPNHIWLLQ